MVMRLVAEEDGKWNMKIIAVYGRPGIRRL